MWENAQLTNAEYRARRHWLINNLGEDVRHAQELIDLDETFRKLSQVQADRNNKIRRRLDMPLKNGEATRRIYTALRRCGVRQAYFFD